MISSWAAWALTVGIGAILGIGLYLLGHHRGYVAGRSNYIGGLPGDAWKAPSSDEFMAEFLERERKTEPPRKYRREP